MFIINYCQAQGPTQGPTQGQGQDIVMSKSDSNSSSKLGPELNTKIGFHHYHSPLIPSLNECLGRRVLSSIMMEPKMNKDDFMMTSGCLLKVVFIIMNEPKCKM